VFSSAGRHLVNLFFIGLNMLVYFFYSSPRRTIVKIHEIKNIKIGNNGSGILKREWRNSKDIFVLCFVLSETRRSHGLPWEAVQKSPSLQSALKISGKFSLVGQPPLDSVQYKDRQSSHLSQPER
jgi:hypothetical protein